MLAVIHVIHAVWLDSYVTACEIRLLVLLPQKVHQTQVY